MACSQPSISVWPSQSCSVWASGSWCRFAGASGATVTASRINRALRPAHLDHPRRRPDQPVAAAGLSTGPCPATPEPPSTSTAGSLSPLQTRRGCRSTRAITPRRGRIGRWISPRPSADPGLGLGFDGWACGLPLPSKAFIPRACRAADDPPTCCFRSVPSGGRIAGGRQRASGITVSAGPDCP
jgi:hypothetical protein